MYPLYSFIRTTSLIVCLLQTCGDIYTHRAILFLMDKHFGLVFMLRTYLGIASNVVQPWVREERKSIGSERSVTPRDDFYGLRC